MMARAASPVGVARALRGFERALPQFVENHRTPMTPVEATSTWSAGMPVIDATKSAELRATAMPRAGARVGRSRCDDRWPGKAAAAREVLA